VIALSRKVVVANGYKTPVDGHHHAAFLLVRLTEPDAAGNARRVRRHGADVALTANTRDGNRPRPVFLRPAILEMVRHIS